MLLNIWNVLLEYIKSGWSITALVSVLILIVAKFAPEEKLLSLIYKPCFTFGLIVSKFLIPRLGIESAIKFETGVIKTLIVVLYSAPKFFLEGMLSDNEVKKDSAAKKINKIAEKVNKQGAQCKKEG